MNKPPYTHCLNCQTELQGKFCHVCGQPATSAKPTIKAFLIEYVNNAFMWDHRFVKTLTTLVRRPGFLTTEFLSGKFISYMHPLKMNMFLLFAFLTLFLLFSNKDKMNNLTVSRLVYPALQMQVLTDDPEMADRLSESGRDTVHLFAPMVLAEKYPDIISLVETIEDTGGEDLDKWVAVIPSMLIEDGYLHQVDGYYVFNQEQEAAKDDMQLYHDIWDQIVHLVSNYFPIIFLLTVPFLSASLSLVNRRSRTSRFDHFIFALHYTAFLEMLIIFIYLLYLITGISIGVLEWILLVGSLVYLTLAFRQVYNTKNWFVGITKAILTNIIYCMICFAIMLAVLIFACVIVAFSM